MTRIKQPAATETQQKLNRKDQAAQTRLLVFNTALKLLEHKDFEDIKIRDIVSEAGVSIGTFYNYFSTKLDVFYETYTLADDYFAEEVQQMLVQPDVRSRVMLYFDEYAGYTAEHSGIKLSKILYNSSNRHFLRTTDHGMLPLLIKTLTKGKEDGQLRQDVVPEEAAEFLMIAARGLAYDWCVHGGEYDLRNTMQTYIARAVKWILKD